MRIVISFRKLGQMLQNLSSAAVVIGALNIKKIFFGGQVSSLYNFLCPLLKGVTYG